MFKKLIMIAALLLAVGCSDDTTGPNKTVIPASDTGGTGDTGGTPGGDTGGDSGNNGGDKDTDGSCSGSDCAGSVITDGECKTVNFLGVLAIDGGKYSFSGDNTGLNSDIATKCAANGADSAELVYGFEVAESAFIDVRILTPSGGVDWVHEIRTGSCTPQARLFCSDPEESRFLARKGERYFVILEPNLADREGAVDVEFEFTPVVCDQPGLEQCIDKAMVICEGGLAETSYDCATGCDQERCAGDVCASAIVVQGAGAHSFSGHLRAFANNFEAFDRASCSMGGALKTPGAEVIFSLPGLVAGQSVKIDASQDAVDNAIFVLPSCAADAACLEASELADTLDWVVPADGDYTVIIDSVAESSKSFEYVIVID